MRFIFLVMLLFSSRMAIAGCSCTGGWYTVWNCCGTCNDCQVQPTYVPIGKVLHTLPITFTWDFDDVNTGNDVCGSSDCGTKYCNAGHSHLENKTLPIPYSWYPPSCNYSSYNELKTTVYGCSYRDGWCHQYCSRYCPSQECGGWTCN